MVNSTAGTDQATASQRVVSTRPSDSKVKTTPTIAASNTEILPVVMGRCAVRLTCRSNLRSAMSLMQQPALRIKKVPSTNTSTRCQPGKPPDAAHNATKVGQTKTSQPAGRLKRIKSRYSARRSDRERGGWAAADMGAKHSAKERAYGLCAAALECHRDAFEGPAHTRPGPAAPRPAHRWQSAPAAGCGSSR